MLTKWKGQKDRPTGLQKEWGKRSGNRDALDLDELKVTLNIGWTTNCLTLCFRQVWFSSISLSVSEWVCVCVGVCVSVCVLTDRKLAKTRSRSCADKNRYILSLSLSIYLSLSFSLYFSLSLHLFYSNCNKVRWWGGGGIRGKMRS